MDMKIIRSKNFIVAQYICFANAPCGRRISFRCLLKKHLDNVILKWLRMNRAPERGTL